jgi:hypothetical protein
MQATGAVLRTQWRNYKTSVFPNNITWRDIARHPYLFTGKWTDCEAGHKEGECLAAEIFDDYFYMSKSSVSYNVTILRISRTVFRESGGIRPLVIVTVQPDGAITPLTPDSRCRMELFVVDNMHVETVEGVTRMLPGTPLFEEVSQLAATTQGNSRLMMPRKDGAYSSVFKRAVIDFVETIRAEDCNADIDPMFQSWLTCDKPGCDNMARSYCGSCKTVWYCGADCQRNHWRSHRATCTTRHKPNLYEAFKRSSM